MQKYWIYFKIEVQRFLQYRSDLIFFTLSGIILPLVLMALWVSVTKYSSNLPFSYNEIILYFLLVLWVEQVNSTWGAYFIQQEINDGKFSNYLLRPFPLAGNYFVQNISEKIYKLFLSTTVAISLAFILLKPISLDLNPVSTILFLFSTVLTFIIAFYIDLIFGISTLWFHQNDFIKNFFQSIEALMSGKIVPLALFPAVFAPFILYSPFRYILSFPIEIILNKLSVFDLILGFSLQLFWLIVIKLFFDWLYQKGIKIYQAYGS